MFNWMFRKERNPDIRIISFEDLEDRRLMSGGHAHHAVRYATSTKTAAVNATLKAGRYSTRARAAATTTTTTTASETTIQFSAAPAAVQTGLAALVPASVTIAPTQSVDVNTDSAGAVTYTAFIRATGFVGTIAVDATGAPVTVTREHGGCGGDHGEHGGESNATTVLFSAVPAAVATQLQSQVDAGVTIPATQTVRTFTNDSGTVVYEAVVNNNGVLKEIASDASGNAVADSDDDGNEHGASQTIVQFSAAPAVVQTGLQG